jgi:hypothetical protein
MVKIEETQKVGENSPVLLFRVAKYKKVETSISIMSGMVKPSNQPH